VTREKGKFATLVKYAVLVSSKLNPDEIRATKISLGKQGRQTHTDAHGQEGWEAGMLRGWEVVMVSKGSN